MKRFRIIAIVAGALLVLSIALWIPLSSGNNAASAPSQDSAPKNVVVAARDIPAYTKITADMVVVKSQPANAVHPNAVTSTEVAVGSWTTADVAAQETLLTNRLVKTQKDAEGEGKGTADPGPLAFTLDHGQRAMSISVDSVKGVGNLLHVGNRVDVILVLEGQNNDALTNSQMLLENKEVIALDQRLSNDYSAQSGTSGNSSSQSGSTNSSSNSSNNANSSQSGNNASSQSNASKTYTTVTLAVAPSEAVKLALGFDQGKVYLILRPQEDTDIASPPPIRGMELVA